MTRTEETRTGSDAAAGSARAAGDGRIPGLGPEMVQWHDDQGEHEEPARDYRRAWRSYAWRFYTAELLLYGWTPAAVALFWVSRLGWHQPILALGIILAWLVAALGMVWWQGEFRCPRCRRRYGALGHKKGQVNVTRGLFDKVCANCKLRKFERS